MPPKRKDRPKSSSSDAFSPEEKKSKEANLSTSTSEAGDEVLTALSMADDLGKKVDMILNKLQKLDKIEARLDNLHKSIASLEESFAFLEKDVQNLKEMTERTRTKVNELEKSVEFREVDISDMQKDLKKVQHEAEELKMQLLYQEHYSRRENLMFLGIQENDAPIDAESETEKNNVENTKEVIYNFLQKELSLENAVSRFEFQRIHRVGKRSGKKPRPIIARFLRYSDREEVLLRAKTSLKGKEYGVFEDMPKELYQLRKAQMKKLQNAKHNGSTAYFSRKYPDKLFIDDYSKGFGGKYGVQKDRVDQAAVGWEYEGKTAAHVSQKDYSKGFGGKYGVQKDRVDKAAVGWEYEGKTEKHESQLDYSKGFGGKYGVQKERVDQAAVGYDYEGKTEKHESQKDYSKGFGGKYGVQKERVDESAVGYDYEGKTEAHASQKDYSKGFGGKYGVQKDRQDAAAGSYDEMQEVKSTYHTAKPRAGSGAAGNLKSKFENLAKEQEEENRRRAEDEKARRQAREQREKEINEKRHAEQEARDRKQREEEARREAEEEARRQEEAEQQQPQEEAEPEEFYEQLSEEQATHEEPTELYEEVTQTQETQEELEAASPDTGMRARAIYDYQAEGEDEISFDPDDIIEDIEQVDEGWWMGTCHGRRGLFPANYVELI